MSAMVIDCDSFINLLVYLLTCLFIHVFLHAQHIIKQSTYLINKSTYLINKARIKLFILESVD